MMHLKLGQVFHGLFYAPNYLAQALNYFEQEDLTVTVRCAQPPSKIIEMLLSGEADIVLAGPARLYERDDPAWKARIVCIGQATARNFFFLVSAAEKEPFPLSRLAGKRLLLFPNTPTPWLCLQYLLRSEGIDPGSVLNIRPETPELSIRRYLSGEADFIELPEPYVDGLLDQRPGHSVIAIGPILGPVPFTVYLADRTMVDQEPERFRRFLRAITRAQLYLREHCGEQVAAAIAQYFPELRLETIVDAIERYQQQDLWGSNPHVAKPEFDRLYRILTGKEKVPEKLYYQVVDSQLL